MKSFISSTGQSIRKQIMETSAEKKNISEYCEVKALSMREDCPKVLFGSLKLTDLQEQYQKFKNCWQI